MTRQEVEAWARAHGWVQDKRYANVYRKGDRRLKFQATSVRYEKGYDSSVDGKTKWINLRSNYYARLALGTGECIGQLIGLGAVHLW